MNIRETSSYTAYFPRIFSLEPFRLKRFVPVRVEQMQHVEWGVKRELMIAECPCSAPLFPGAGGDVIG